MRFCSTTTQLGHTPAISSPTQPGPSVLTCPSHSKPSRRIHEPRDEMREPPSRRHKRGHLCSTLQHAPHDGAHNGKRQQQTQRSGSIQPGSDTDEETDPNSAAETDE